MIFYMGLLVFCYRILGILSVFRILLGSISADITFEGSHWLHWSSIKWRQGTQLWCRHFQTSHSRSILSLGSQTYIWVFREALFIIAKIGSSQDVFYSWINKQTVKHQYNGYYLAIIRNSVPSHEKTQKKHQCNAR